MPIKGISDVRRLPRLGKVRLGIKAVSKRTGGEYPKPVDYFVVREDNGITSPTAAEAFHEVYGDKPHELDIMFPIDDEGLFFQQWLRRYGSGRGLICKGDGETAVRVDKKTGILEEIECDPDECPYAIDRSCRPVATLMFILPRVAGLGCWQLDTSSWNSIVNLNSAIDFIGRLTGGRIAMIPLKLILRPRDVQPEGKKKRVWVLDLALEHLSMEQVLRPPDLATQFLPPDSSHESPDDLFPQEEEAEPEQEDTMQPETAVGIEISNNMVIDMSLQLRGWATGARLEAGHIEDIIQRWRDGPHTWNHFFDLKAEIEGDAKPPAPPVQESIF